jgi:serine protease
MTRRDDQEGFVSGERDVTWGAGAARRDVRAARLAAFALGVGALTLGATARADDAVALPEREDAWDVPGVVVVDADDGLDDAEVRTLGLDFGLSLTPSRLAGSTRIHLADVGPSRVAELLGKLRRDGRVERAEPLARVRAMFEANDPLLGEQWHMARVGAPRAWDFSSGRGVTVAVVDTGIACEDHGPFSKGTDLAGTRCVGGWSFITNDAHANDDQGHGTHVAGTIAQSTNNGLGAVGVAFHASLMPVKVLNESGWGSTVDVADGIRWAADHGAHVINLSLGGPRNSKILEEAVAHARSKGVVVVAAAGNSGGRVGYPGATEGVIGVSASDPDDKLAKFSSRGAEVDLAAPGVSVVQQTICNKGRGGCEVFPAYNGTSMAAPHVAGAAALLVGMGVTDPDAVERALEASARVVDGSEGGRKLFGAGILDASAAVLRVHVVQLAARLLALLAITGLLVRATRAAGAKGTSPLRPSFVLAALFTGTGLFAFLPFVAPRVWLAVDLLSRPFGEWDLLVGASVHKLLPLANALVPFGLTALFLGVKRLRPMVAGVAAGTAAYLVSVAALGQLAGPFGLVPTMVWCAVNALACVWIARVNLVES